LWLKYAFRFCRFGFAAAPQRPSALIKEGFDAQGAPVNTHTNKRLRVP
jgi:hypothetical protein